MVKHGSTVAERLESLAKNVRTADASQLEQEALNKAEFIGDRFCALMLGTSSSCRRDAIGADAHSIPGEAFASSDSRDA